MDSCVTFPKEAILICRPSLRKACGENRNAAKFLSYLLFRASIREEAKLEAQHINAVHRALGRAADQDTSITIYRTQGQIVREMDEEICDRTLRDEAIPCLVELGYLSCEEIKGDKQYTAYTIHPDAIQQGIDHPEHVPHFKTMTFYQGILETRARKKFRSENSPDRSENFPSGSEFSPHLHGENSEPELLPQHAPQATREDISTAPKSNKKDSKKETQESNASSSADAHTRALQQLPIVITTPAVAFPHDEEHDTTTVSVASLGDEASTPAAHASEHGEPPKSAKTRKKKTIVSLTDATPVPTPEKPPADEPWTPLTCLKLADYYRGETLPESERKDSPYQKAVQAAISLVNRQRMTYEQVDAVFRYMKGIDASLKDDWWTDKKVDLWHVAEHCAVKLRERERKAKKTELVVSGPAPSSPERPSVLVSEEKRQRNLERLRALAEAKAPQEHERAATLAR